MYKFLYFGKWYASGLSLDEIWAYGIDDAGKVAMHPSILSADKITNMQAMK